MGFFKKVTKLKDEDVIEHNSELSEIKITSNGQAVSAKKPEAAKGQSSSTDFLSVDAIGALRRFSKEHELDPNLPLDELEGLIWNLAGVQNPPTAGELRAAT